MSTIHLNRSFPLECGNELESLSIHYQTFGKLNADKSNVVWVCHALTANSNVLEWWDGLFGYNDLFDPEQYFIVCPNALGSCYGTTGPNSPGVNTRPLLKDFPTITTRDMANAHDLLRQRLGIDQISITIGASLGGQQAVEWAIERPEVHKKLVLIACNARHSAYGVAFNESQRQAIYSCLLYTSPSPRDA